MRNQVRLVCLGFMALLAILLACSPRVSTVAHAESSTASASAEASSSAASDSVVSSSSAGSASAASSSSAGSGVISATKDLDGRSIGVQTGSTFDSITLKSLPNAKLSYFNSYPDMAEALLSKKIDAFPGDEPVIRMIVAENNSLAVLDDPLETFEFGIVLPKNERGEQLRNEINAWLKTMRDSGDLDAVTQKWISGSDSEKELPQHHNLPSTKGMLTLATEGQYPPLSYYRNGEVVGLEIELAIRFCSDNGYGLDVQAMNFDGILPAVQSGKADFAMAGISITPERAESVLFSDPYYKGGTVMAVRASDLSGATQTEAQNGSFFGSIAESFEKTFLREDRWKLFIEGVKVTLIITLLSILLGTALGFGIYVLCRKGGAVANGIAGVCMWLIQGMPTVVLLMVLYYIIFGSVTISGIVVSTVGFTLTFGTAVFGMLRMGVGAVDDGQREAAYAMGYSEGQTFFKIILPQALPHVVPAFRSEIIGLIKATSIVGYIAVQDLTKMGDIIRSRTYEAFFPLIAVAIIYFVLEELVGLIANILRRYVNPKRRSSERILRGVKTDD